MNRIVNIKLTDSGSDPVSVDDAKVHLRVDHANDDDYITSLIGRCRSEMEGVCGVSVVAKTVELIADWDTEQRLPYGPVASITSVHRKENGEWASIAAADYTLDGSTFDGPEGRLKIVYVTEAIVSLAMESTLLNLIAFRYENRGDSGNELPDDLNEQLNQHRDFTWL